MPKSLQISSFPCTTQSPAMAHPSLVSISVILLSSFFFLHLCLPLSSQNFNSDKKSFPDFLSLEINEVSQTFPICSKSDGQILLYLNPKFYTFPGTRVLSTSHFSEIIQHFLCNGGVTFLFLFATTNNAHRDGTGFGESGKILAKICAKSNFCKDPLSRPF